MEYLRIKHQYNAGDLLTVMCSLNAYYQRTGKKTRIYQYLGLPAFYYEGATHPIRDMEGNMVCMNQKMFDMLKPLVEAQEYVESFRVWEGEEVDLDFQHTRDKRQVPLPYSDIYKWASFVFPELNCDAGSKWIKAAGLLKKVSIVINRTERYQNPYISYYFLKPYQEKCIFVGTPSEHAAFNEKWGLDIQYQEVTDFLHLAHIINTCKFGIYNQSMAFHIANGLKSPRILEVCAQFPNTMPYGEAGYSFLYQESLEYYFHKLNQQ